MLPGKKIFLILVLFLFSITGIRLIFLSYQIPLDHPKAIRGILDLRGWTIPHHRTIALNGEWEFSPSQFIAPDSKAAVSDRNAPEAAYIQVPGAWEHAFPEDQDPSFRYGTYRLQILIDDSYNENFKLRINRINTASAVYVNGRLAAQHGIPSEQKDLHQARVTPYTVTLPSGGKSIEIMIHVSNHAGKGGITESIRFGTLEAIDHRTLLSTGLQLGLCIIFLIHGLYGAMLYFFGVANKGLLYFSLVMLMAIFIVLVADDKLLFVWIPMPYEYYLKIAVLSYVGVVAFMPPLLKHMFTEGDNAKWLRWFAVYSTLYAVFILIAPSRYIAASLFLLASVLLISIIVSGYILHKAIRKNEDVIYVLLGITAIGVNIVWSIINGRTSFEMLHYPVDLMIAVFAFAAFWFKRFFRTNVQTKLLAEKLQLANKQKDDFLVNTSHELRNPLHGIMNLSQSVLDDPLHPVPDVHRKRLEVQISVARRMSLMLDDLLDVTRLKERTIRLKVGSMHMLPVVQGIVEVLKFMLNGKPVFLHIGIADRFPAVKADENRLAQILFNLLHNAIKFTDEGTISVYADVVNGMAHIHIKDTGIGMDEETQQRIFLPYEQGDSDRSRALGGFGLGLSISKQLVELHGGSLKVVSSPGEGSVFTFTLPLSEEADHWGITEPLQDFILAETAASISDIPVGAALPASAAASDKPKILVVDDDSINLKILADILGTVEYDIVTAANATDALAKIETASYDLIISDVMMPHISGYELTRMIRERFSVTELPILLLTARTRPEDLFAGFQAGSNDYVTKPVDSWELKSRVRALIELKLSIEERLRMEAAWLQAQIQPHFLYNTINSIAALGTLDIAKMQTLLEEFSNYLRTSFDFHNTDRMVSIDRELALVRSYLYIEKERYDDRLDVQWSLDPNLHFLLPPLSIQPLVENAVNHGVLRRNSGGTIYIGITKNEACYEICIRDNGVGMNEEKLLSILDRSSDSNKGIALKNTDRRLKKLYGKGLRIQSVLGQGTAITFQIPK